MCEVAVDGGLHELVTRAAARHGARTAVCDEGAGAVRRCCSYRQLVCRAEALRQRLQLHCQCTHGHAIGMYCQPSVNLPSCILGILQAGAAFCPLDPESSPRLSAYFIQMCKMKYILIQKDIIQKFIDSLSGWLSFDVECDIPQLDVILVKIQWLMTNVDSFASEPRSTENVIHTKVGVLKEERLQTTDKDKINHASKHVDCHGFLAYILQTSGTTGAPKIVRVPHQCIVPNIQHLIHEGHVPLGVPLSGTILNVMDDSGQVIQEGEGQVFIGGKERICFLNEEITVSPGTMRATGDWVIVKGGQMYYLGRKDNQIKRHGKRVNLESIQLVAESLKQVEACVMTKCDQDKLILFVVPRGLPEQQNTSSIDFCRGILSDLGKLVSSHAIPDDVVQIGSIPFTAHGKIDQRALIRIYHEKTKSLNSDHMLTKKELWEGIHRLWKVVLHLPEDHADASDHCMFLYSGGDSLKALRLVEEIETLVKQRIFGLIEVILNSPVLDIYNYISNAIFCEIEKKEKLGDKSNRRTTPKKMKDKSAGFYSKQITQWKSITINDSIATISRGSQITKLHVNLNSDNSADKLGIQEDNVLTDGDSNGEEKKGLNFLNLPENMNENISLTEEKMPLKNNWLELFGNQIVNPLHGDEKFIPDNLSSYRGTISFKVRWKSDTAKCVDASPLLVISGNNGTDVTVYIGSHSHRLQAIDIFSGEIKWERILGDRIESSACLSRCGNFIIVGCYDGYIYVLRRVDGETYWTFYTQNSVKSSPIVDPDLGLVFIGSHDQHVYALDILDKVCAWKLHCGRGAVFSTPYLNKSPRLLYVATLGESLIAVNPDSGSTVWKRSCGKPLFSSPQCTSRSVYIGCVDGSLHCFSHNGDQLWQFSTGGPIFSSPCIYHFSATKQKIIFGSYDSFVYCLNEDGDLVWKFETSKQVYAVPFLYPNSDFNGRTLVAVMSTDGSLWILVAATGELITSYSLPGEVFSSPVIWENKLIVGCRNNYVYCVEMSTLEEKSPR
ncbi:beta-alanine-activating enzyme isoform X2 [Amblyraja radiata]|uniref:beta-alanine-activating enzyme isoform X2 n=1 Tax=Amblyraja radiata TaxID=386614 RepID=UPI001402F3FC|nr:beta-alanine-activating enzyme isoform X2 [Amblyraja radiata]